MFIIDGDFVSLYFIDTISFQTRLLGFVNVKMVKLKVKPCTNEQDHLELILRPKEHESWLEALINDDKQAVESILSKCSNEEKNNYLNGCFEVSENEKVSVKSRCPIGLKDRDTKESFSHSLHMAVAFGSHQAIKSLIKHECNVLVTNVSGRNAIHCLIYVSFMRVDIEDEMIETFRTIKENVSSATLRDLLMQEDDCGCRPAEYAMHLGVFSIVREILHTKGIFLTSVEYNGCLETSWFDITEYEESRERMSRSPVVLLALLDRNRLENQHFNELFFSQAFQQWIHAKARAAGPFLFLWFVVRILFGILYYAADSALLFSEETYFMKSQQINTSSCLQFSDRKSTEVPGFSCVAACIIYCILMTICEISENYLWFFHKSYQWMHKTPAGPKPMVVQIAFYKVSQMMCYLSVACSLTVRLLRLKKGLDISFTFDHVSYSVIGFCISWSILQFAQALPAVGHFAVSLQRMLKCLLAFMLLFVSFAITFVIIFNKLVNQNKITCVPEFSTTLDSLYSTWRALINMMQFRYVSVSDRVTLYLAHVLYVGIGSIMMLNFVIATFSAVVSWVDSHRKVILTIQRLSMIIILESRITRILDKLYRKYQSHYFILRNNRIYLTQTTPILPRQAADTPISV